MRFRRSKRTSELDALRGEVARLRTEVRGAIDDTRETMAQRDTELARALRRVADTCQVVAGRIEGERIERAALVDSMRESTAALVEALTVVLDQKTEPVAVSARPRHRVLGGTIDPGVRPIDLTGDAPAAHSDSFADR